MKLIILEASASELSANKRVSDSLCDVLEGICDSFVRMRTPSYTLAEDEEEEDEDERE